MLKLTPVLENYVANPLIAENDTRCNTWTRNDNDSFGMIPRNRVCDSANERGQLYESGTHKKLRDKAIDFARLST